MTSGSKADHEELVNTTTAIPEGATRTSLASEIDALDAIVTKQDARIKELKVERDAAITAPAQPEETGGEPSASPRRKQARS